MPLTLYTLGPGGRSVRRRIRAYLTYGPGRGYGRVSSYVVRVYATGTAYRRNAAPYAYVVTGANLTPTAAYRTAVRAYLAAYRAATGRTYPNGAGYVGYATRVAATATTVNLYY